MRQSSTTTKWLPASVAGLVFSIAGFFVVNAIAGQSPSAGDKGPFIIGLLVGIPVGSLAGIYLVLKKPTILGVVFSILFGGMATLLAALIVAMTGGVAIVLAPVLVTTGSLVGHVIGTLMFGSQASQDQNSHKNGA